MNFLDKTLFWNGRGPLSMEPHLVLCQVICLLSNTETPQPSETAHTHKEATDPTETVP